jgi:hypothetical protein
MWGARLALILLASSLEGAAPLFVAPAIPMGWWKTSRWKTSQWKTSRWSVPCAGQRARAAGPVAMSAEDSVSADRSALPPAPIVVSGSPKLPRRHTAIMIKRTKAFLEWHCQGLESHVGAGARKVVPSAAPIIASSPDISPDFEYFGPAMEFCQQDRYFGFSVDSLAPRKVWFHSRAPDGSARGVQSCLLTFDAEGLVSSFTVWAAAAAAAVKVGDVDSPHGPGGEVAAGAVHHLQQEITRLTELSSAREADLRRQLAQQRQESEEELASLREQFQRLDGAQFANGVCLFSSHSRTLKPSCMRAVDAWR